MKLLYFPCYRQLHISLSQFPEYRVESWNLLVDSRTDWLSIRNSSGQTPLLSLVNFLVEFKFEKLSEVLSLVRALAVLSNALPVADCRGNTALHYAAYIGSVELIDALLQPPSIDECALRRSFLTHAQADSDGPLAETIEAALERHGRAVAALLESRNAMDETALYCAVKASRVAATRHLIQWGADPRISVNYTSILFNTMQKAF